MAIDDAQLLTDRGYLQGVQYRTDANLAARQSIYAYERPGLGLTAGVLDLAQLTGTETVADIGCGNGRYLAGLTRRGHQGHLLGVDLSTGMLRAAAAGAPAAGLTAADAVALPLADAVADVTLANHMLYHVHDQAAAVAELRRVTRPGGRVLVVLNASHHLRELRELVAAASAELGLAANASWAENRGQGVGIDVDRGAELLATVFATVERHDFSGELLVPGPEPVLGYVRSMRFTQNQADPEVLTAAVARRLPAGPFRVRTGSGCLVCR